MYDLRVQDDKKKIIIIIIIIIIIVINRPTTTYFINNIAPKLRYLFFNQTENETVNKYIMV